jgi:hypothetical protein
MRSASSIHRGGPREPEHRCPAPSNRGTRRAGARRCKLPATRMTARGRRLIADGLVRSTRKRGHALSTLTLTRRDLALLTAIDAGRCQVVDPTVPDLRVDDRWFCDQPRARVLMAAGLLAGPDRPFARRRARPADQGRPGRAPRRPTITGLPWPRWPTPPRSTAGRCRRSGPRPRHDHARVPKRHGCDGRRTRARHGRGGVPSGDSDTGPAQARPPWRTGAARRVGFQSRPERVTCGHRLRVLGTRTLTEYGGQHPRRGGKGQRCPSSQPTLRRRTMRPTRKPTTITMAT